ncbi:MAG: 1-acyl-sn-glycerol-3-phosphate acyltransferase [Candidatus Gastranaerophilales bacterium]|nr:1-acyl-sn-glycerol-3-phosphate acyltransferase [Candidatus Gastranaerophilales bacterium]
MPKSYSQRKPSEFNLFRRFCVKVTCSFIYGLYYKLVCNLKIEGRENVPKKGFYIVASNHESAVDPFLVVHAVGRPIAFMAKKELFEKQPGRFFLDILGAFAVNREKLEVSTIKTAIGIKDTGWLLGLFPQGTRETHGNMENISRGFAAIAKITKSDILPVAITGAMKEERHPFKGKIKIKIGKPISYRDDTHEMVNVWINTISELSNSGG